MATLSSTGPNPLNPSQQATCTLSVDDDVLVGVVQAVCHLCQYSDTMPNPAFEQAENNTETIPNPDYVPRPEETIWNPDYDESDPESLHDIPNPALETWVEVPETIPNPDYVPPRIPNTEGPGEFTMRMIKEWLMIQLKAYRKLQAEQEIEEQLQSKTVTITSEVIE